MFDSAVSIVLVVLAILGCVIAAIFFSKYSVLKQQQQGSSGEPGAPRASGTSALDPAIQAKIQALLSGESIALSKEEHQALSDRAALADENKRQNEELKAQIEQLQREQQTLRTESQQQEVSRVTEISDLKATCEHLQKQLQEKDAAIATAAEQQQKALQEAKAERDAALLEQKTIAAAALSKVEQERDSLKSDKENLQQELTAQAKLLASAHSENESLKQMRDADNERAIKIRADLEAAMSEQKTSAAEAIAKVEQERDRLKRDKDSLQQELTEQAKKLAAASSENESLKQIRQADQERFDKSQADLEHRLNTMGEKLLNERSAALNKLNNEQMGQVINPLKEELDTFRKLISDTQKTSSEQAGQLKNELAHLQEAQVSLTNQADILAKALLKGGKSQGMWGEQQLERVLDMAGLEKGVQYSREVVGGNEGGDSGRADAVVWLPNKHGIVIDAKCSLTAYTDLVNAEMASDQEAYARALKEHLSSVRKHIDELVKKNYPSYKEYGSPNFVFMFVPVDQALAIALKEDPKLYDDSQKSNVILVSPSILMPALRIVGNLWVMAGQSEKLKKIVTAADRIYQKSRKVCTDFENVIKARDTLNKNIDQLNTSFMSGRGNLTNLLRNFASDAPQNALAIATIDADLADDIDNNNDPLVLVAKKPAALLAKTTAAAATSALAASTADSSDSDKNDSDKNYGDSAKATD